MDSSMFVKSIIIDGEGRIVVSVQDQFTSYLKDDMIKKMLKDSAVKSLGDDFIQLEVSSTTFRVSVKEGSSENSKTVIEEEIVKSIEAALSFMNQFNA